MSGAIEPGCDQSRGRSWYFSESRYSSLPSRTAVALAELVAAVHPPGRAGDRREHGAHPEGGRAAVLQRRVQDVGRVHPEVGPEPVDQLSL